jgi:hypothetical protein
METVYHEMVFGQEVTRDSRFCIQNFISSSDSIKERLTFTFSKTEESSFFSRYDTTVRGLGFEEGVSGIAVRIFSQEVIRITLSLLPKKQEVTTL